MRKKSGNFKKRVDEALDYLKDSMRYIWFIFAIFIFSSLIGFFYSEKFSFIADLLRDILAQTEGLSMFELVVFIFRNNIISAFFGLVLGVFFGVVPLINSISNGVVLGYVLNGTYKVSGLGEFWRLLPHGVFELPAIFISLGLGLKLGMFMFSKGKNKSRELGRRFLNSLILFFLIVLPLLIIAAFIESSLISFYG